MTLHTNCRIRSFSIILATFQSASRSTKFIACWACRAACRSTASAGSTERMASWSQDHILFYAPSDCIAHMLSNKLKNNRWSSVSVGKLRIIFNHPLILWVPACILLSPVNQINWYTVVGADQYRIHIIGLIFPPWRQNHPHNQPNNHMVRSQSWSR